MHLICKAHSRPATRFLASDPIEFYCQDCEVPASGNIFPMELYGEPAWLAVREFLRKSQATSERLESPKISTNLRMCQNTDFRPATVFGVSTEAEFYCDTCAQNQPYGEVFSMELYESAVRLGFSEFLRRQKDSAEIKAFIQSLKMAEEKAHKRTEMALTALYQSLKDWTTARNATFTEWIRQTELENEEYSSGKTVSTAFQDVQKLRVTSNAESQVLDLLYDLNPVQDKIAVYNNFKETHPTRQSDSFAQQIYELCHLQPTSEPSLPEPLDPLPICYPLLSDSICMQWDLKERKLRRVAGPKMLFQGKMGVVHVEDSRFFLSSCGVSKKETAIVDLSTGRVEMYPDLNHERESCGLLHYKGFIYFFGGYQGSKYGLTRTLILSPPTLSVERLSLATHQYKELADMKHPRYSFNAVRWRQKVYLAGGWNSEGSIDVYDLLTNSFFTLPDAIAFDRVSCACVVGEDLVVFTQDIMKKWRINESGRGQMEEIRLSTSVDDLWSNLTPINTTEGVICVQFPTFTLYTLNATTGNIRMERLKERSRL